MRDTVFLCTMNTLQIVIDPEMLATPTEQYGMTSCSIDALVERRNPRGEQLDLNMGKIAVLRSIVTQLRIWQILDGVEIEKSSCFGRY